MVHAILLCPYLYITIPFDGTPFGNRTIKQIANRCLLLCSRNEEDPAFTERVKLGVVHKSPIKHIRRTRIVYKRVKLSPVMNTRWSQLDGFSVKDFFVSCINTKFFGYFDNINATLVVSSFV